VAWNIALLPTSGSSAKLVMSSQIWLTTTLYRSISLSGTPSKVKIKNAKAGDHPGFAVVDPIIHASVMVRALRIGRHPDVNSTDGGVHPALTHRGQ
jgi:hypothetical protein